MNRRFAPPFARGGRTAAIGSASPADLAVSTVATNAARNPPESSAKDERFSAADQPASDKLLKLEVGGGVFASG